MYFKYMAGFCTKTFKVCDDYMTPAYAWEYIRKYIPTNKIIWEPFYGDGTSGKILCELGFEIIHEKEDFFENNKGEIVISNPPFSLKKEIITRLVELNKPFILLMPVATMYCNYVRDLIGDELQIMIPRKRIHFNKLVDGKATETSKCNFDCAFFCWRMNLPRDLIYLEAL